MRPLISSLLFIRVAVSESEQDACSTVRTNELNIVAPCNTAAKLPAYIHQIATMMQCFKINERRYGGEIYKRLALVLKKRQQHMANTLGNNNEQ